MITIDTTALRDRIAGQVVTPADAGYDEARAIYNGMIDRRPAVIARCRSVDDVRTALDYGRRSGSAIAVRGGGHNGPGFGTVEGGLVIDLSEMNAVDVDPAARTVRVQGGATWGAVDAATHQHGLALPSGIFSTTGVGGLTLGGGHGYLSRKYGLTIDNLLAAEVVLTDGRVVTASETEHPDLFWALRGGGGNFGVVTSFVFRCHPVTNVIAGPTLWPVEATAEVLSWYRDFMPAQNEDLYGFFATMTVPPGDPFPAELHLRKACGVVWCYTGDPADADAAFAPVREQEPQWEGIGSVPYPGLQSAFDPLYPKGLQWYWRGDFVRTIPDEAVAVHARFAEQLPTPLSTMHLYPIDGAVQRVRSADTAWNHRDVTWSGVIGGIDPDPGNAAAISRWTVDYWQAQHPYSAGGAYVNFMMDEGPDRVRATYGANYDRLCAVKAVYDPENVLRINQNLPTRDLSRARVSGVATFREQQVRFAFDQDVARVNRVVRERQLEVVGGVPLDEWARSSRCAGWSVHDVVRHVAQMNEMVVGVAAAARVGERYRRARRFDPRTTPSEWLAEAPAADPEETLAAFAQSTDAVVEAGGALGADVLVGTPVGLQMWPRMVLHALFDAVVHERDVTQPLGRSAPAIPEQLPVVAYVLLVAARVACAVDREFAVTLDVGEQVLSVSVHGADVEVVPAERNAAAPVPADPLPLLDGLSGRVPLDEVLAAPDDVRAALGMLARNM